MDATSVQIQVNLFFKATEIVIISVECSGLLFNPIIIVIIVIKIVIIILIQQFDTKSPQTTFVQNTSLQKPFLIG